MIELDPNDPSRDEPDELTQAEISFVSVTVDHDANAATAPLRRDNPRDVFNDSANYEEGSSRADVRFGQGPNGEIYVSSKKNGGVYLVANSLPVVSADPAIPAETVIERRTYPLRRLETPRVRQRIARWRFDGL